MVSSSSPSSPRKTSAVVAATGQHRGHDRRHPRVGAPHREACRPGRVGQRAEEVERRRHADLAPRHRRRAAGPGGTPARSRSRSRPPRRSGPRAGPGSPIATPSASSTSAAPADELAARLPCLATRAPAPAATSADIVERLTVLARSPPVPTTSSSGPATCTRSPTASIASTRPVCSAGVSPLARSSTANAASWDGDASPAMISAIAQAVSAASSGSPRSSVLSTAGQLCPPVTALPYRRTGTPRARSRSSCATVSAAATGSSGTVDRGVGERPGGQPPVVPPAEQDADRRAVFYLVFQLPADAHPAGRLGLAVEDRDVDAALVDPGDDLVTGGALDPLDATEVGRRTATDRRADLRPHRREVAEDEDGRGRARCGHARESRTGPAASVEPVGSCGKAARSAALPGLGTARGARRVNEAVGTRVVRREPLAADCALAPGRRDLAHCALGAAAGTGSRDHVSSAS